MSSLVEFHLKITYFFGIFGGLAHLCRIIEYLWHPISKPEYVISSKVTVVLKSTDQGHSILGLISLLKWCLVWWNSIWKLLFSLNIFDVFAHLGIIIKYLWQPISSPEYVINLKVKVLLKTTDQGLSKYGLITMIKCCIVWWNSICKWHIFWRFYILCQNCNFCSS